MKHQRYKKEETQISHSEFYTRMRWIPSKKPQYTVGDIVNFKNSDFVDNIGTFEGTEWVGLILAITTMPGQEYSYTIKYLDLWENGQKIETHEGNIIGKL